MMRDWDNARGASLAWQREWWLIPYEEEDEQCRLTTRELAMIAPNVASLSKKKSVSIL